MHIYQLETKGRDAMINIDHPVQKAVEDLGIKDGIVTVYCPHSTAGVTINESDDPAVQKDIIRRLNDLVPLNLEYGHAEGNSDAHIKAALIGSSVQVPVVKGQIRLGRWQAIYFCEFDGPRKREIWIK
ncbi:secondary thiamine-phosphate synthase enzyme YjbQ [Patescibacteria group bacterium]|nr:secondary thiamine-phosphate synthase enzyme YjbQ [Patescibacteria group bacterium]MBU1016092.1 secondary thiamine-phosphate synthase enzyme YjbQ [Patescibacteria group bacterium]MBU1684835.1 secondary thiamine-phosphate synthase enzyme YjbQ [Patescibacteria group bacterium]MBU1938551.1 secondary thiamine-phosphate synthase enzyme YjbQ [Patescibacteria group bacterium]